MRFTSTARLAAVALLAATGAHAADTSHAVDSGTIDYTRQDQWIAVLDKAQSPIDIVTRDAVPASANEPRGLEFWHTRHAVGSVEDNGHAVQFDTSTIEARIRGRHFQLTQLHFHTPGEHTINGRRYPLEAHLVFKAQDGALAVAAAMYQAGPPNAAVQTIVDGLRDGAHTGKEQVLDVEHLLPRDLSYYHYLGSLTTPPLTQDVEWYVLKQPVALGADQLAALRQRHADNNRKLQPLNGRPLIDSND